jgi:phosphoribosylaminoimidazole-succinocarboxamide synthase
MTLNLKNLKKLAEGKTKIIYENPGDPKTVTMAFKDDITAGDGVKHDVMEGKALVDWMTNRNIFEYLNKKGVKTHYISSPQEKVSIVKRLDFKINLEVVTRRVAAGSILKWSRVAEGDWYDPPVTQFHYKDDPLHDPMLDEAYIDFIVRTKQGGDWYSKMRELNVKVILELEKAFAKSLIQLVDLKLEYGLINGEVTVIDEITGGSFRLWPYANPNPNLKLKNVIKELAPEGRLDKDTYRMGGGLDKVKSKFEEIAKITEGFKNL